MAADINLDGGIPFFPINDVILYGQEHSSLGPIAQRAAAEAGLDVTADPWPEEVTFIRQDALSFVRKGVPSLYVNSGIKSRDPKVDGSAVYRRWLETIYHSPKDDARQAFDYESGAGIARFVFRLCHAVANSAERPKWNQGDFFEQKFRVAAGPGSIECGSDRPDPLGAFIPSAPSSRLPHACFRAPTRPR
jgi:Zn-dependent M28 family amino/carboxypeptidase